MMDGGIQVPLPLQFPAGAVRRTREQHVWFGSEQPHVQGPVRAIWAKMSRGQLDTEYLSRGQALTTESPAGSGVTVGSHLPHHWPSVYTK